jgi:flavin reductase (DIM6/NTAB) family NADH-FMN oxidoreductase RutF
MRVYKKKDIPPSLARRYLEPGPVVLISSAHKGERDIMDAGWHMVMETEPSLIGCYIWDKNHSYDLIRASRECVINLPTADMAAAVIGIGNTHGPKIEKFGAFGLTPAKASKVGAPLIAECYAHFECKLVDDSLIRRYSLFVFKVVKASTAVSPAFPRTLHYRGEGIFMVSGGNVDYKKRFKPENL